MAQQTIDLNTRVFQMPGCVSADLGGETAILDPESGLYFSLNKVGAVIWETIQQPRQLSGVLDLLLGEFDVDQDRCTREMLELVKSLREHKLVQIDP